MNREQAIAGKIATSVESAIDKMARLTDRNMHTEAAILLAETLGDRKYLEVLKAIKVIADFRRHLPRDLGEIRYNMLKDMWDDARDKWGDEIGQKVYDAF